MSNSAKIQLLRSLLTQIRDPIVGRAMLENYPSLRAVDGVIREARQLIVSLDGLPPDALEQLTTDENFKINSRRVRLEALAIHVESAIRFATSGALSTPGQAIYPPPDIGPITTNSPGLEQTIRIRWREAQQCVQAGAFIAAVITMGSILEGLLLSKALMSIEAANRAHASPKDKFAKVLAIHEWKLTSLIDVAVELRWIKRDRGAFSHALRDSRNLVHPWHETQVQAQIDLATCKTSWEVLQAAVDDLLATAS